MPQRTLGQSDNLPSATPLALGKDIYSPSASKDTRQNQTERPASSCYDFFAECHILDTRHTLDLPSVYITALGKSRVCRVSLFCRVFNCLHSVKGSFAECSNFGTRQSRRHSANIGFPVVNVTIFFLDLPSLFRTSLLHTITNVEHLEVLQLSKCHLLLLDPSFYY